LGYLIFSYANEMDHEVPKSIFPKDMQGSFPFAKLVIVEVADQSEPVEAESGIVLTSAAGQELILVSSVSPWSITASASFLPIEDFTPEYDIEHYGRIRLLG